MSMMARVGGITKRLFPDTVLWAGSKSTLTAGDVKLLWQIARTVQDIRTARYRSHAAMLGEDGEDMLQYDRDAQEAEQYLVGLLDKLDQRN